MRKVYHKRGMWSDRWSAGEVASTVSCAFFKCSVVRDGCADFCVEFWNVVFIYRTWRECIISYCAGSRKPIRYNMLETQDPSTG